MLKSRCNLKKYMYFCSLKLTNYLMLLLLK